MGALRPADCFWILALVSWAISFTVATPIFYESFSDLPWQQRWSQSERKGYEGTWTVEESYGNADLGIVASERDKKYALARKLAEPVQLLSNRTIVLQYDVRFQKGIECGGAYLKFLEGDLDKDRHHAWNPKLFHSDSPYSIMFGPDRCNRTNKVHFIFCHKNPKTGEILQHHLKYPPAPPTDRLSHVYTAIIYGHNSSVKLLIDGVPRRSSRLLSIEFDPPVLLPSTIPDPTDTKPEDWDDRALIPDPERSTKPDDWDEHAPLFIEDTKARKPKGWLDDEPPKIPLKGSNPVRMVTNPKCVKAPGCGEWRPTIRNPAFKGKWHPPTIRNPNFKGKWAPRRIPNPEYHHLDDAELAPIGGIGIDIFAMEDGLIFDNILITDSESEALAYRKRTWQPKYTRERRLVDRSIPMLLFDAFKFLFFELVRRCADASILKTYKPILLEHINNIERDLYLSRSVFLSVVVVWNTMLYRLLCVRRPKKRPANAAIEADTAGMASENVGMAETNTTTDATSRTDESDAPHGAAKDDSKNEGLNSSTANAENGSDNTMNGTSIVASPPPTRFFF